MSKDNSQILQNLFQEIKAKLKEDPEISYTAFLANAGIENIGKKIIEEANEVVDAATKKDKKEIILESADLIYHLLVMIAYKELDLEQILQELENRRAKKDLSKKSIAKNKMKLGYGK